IEIYGFQLFLLSFPTRRSSDLLPAVKSATALSNEMKAYLPPVSFSSTNVILSSSCQQLFRLGRFGLACSTSLMTLKLKSLILFRSEEHTSELQSHENLVCRLLL